MTPLVIVDMQYGFYHPDRTFKNFGMPVSHHLNTILTINKLHKQSYIQTCRYSSRDRISIKNASMLESLLGLHTELLNLILYNVT